MLFGCAEKCVNTGEHEADLLYKKMYVLHDGQRTIDLRSTNREMAEYDEETGSSREPISRGNRYPEHLGVREGVVVLVMVGVNVWPVVEV